MSVTMDLVGDIESSICVISYLYHRCCAAVHASVACFVCEGSQAMADDYSYILKLFISFIYLYSLIYTDKKMKVVMYI